MKKELELVKNATNKYWKLVLTVIFVPTILLVAVSLIYKMNYFIGKIVFPCEVREYSWGLSEYCTGADFFAVIGVVFIFIFIFVRFLINESY